MRLECTSLFPCSVEVLQAELAKPQLLLHVAAPMLDFVPVDPPEFPATWSPGSYSVRLLVGGRVPIGDHTLVPQDVPAEAAPLVWDDQGYSGLIKVWRHRILLEDVHGMTRYHDRVEVRAGLLTVPAWLFAWLFYTHRQRRLGRLITARFDYERAR